MQTIVLSSAASPARHAPFSTGARRITHPAQPQSSRIARRELRLARAEVQQTAAAEQAAGAASGSESDGDERVPPGCARYTVELPKPLGLVLEEGKGGRGVYVAEILPEGNAARLAPEIGVGDELIATNGLTYTTQQEYQGNMVKGGEKYVRLNVRSNTFSTVMAAIGTVKPPRKVVLEFQRCQ